MNIKDDFGIKGNYKTKKDNENILIKYIPLLSDRSIPMSLTS